MLIKIKRISDTSLITLTEKTLEYLTPNVFELALISVNVRMASKKSFVSMVSIISDK